MRRGKRGGSGGNRPGPPLGRPTGSRWRSLLNPDTLGSEAAPAMITKLDMMNSMLEACPSFRPQCDKFLAEWNSEDDKPLYLALGSLARYLIQKLATRDVDSLSRAFAVVERWHREGDSFVREAATVGLLEDLQNENLHESTTPMEFEPFLLTESAKCWKKVDLFWRNSDVISDE